MHELGHNLSLQHADALFCFTPGEVDVNLRKLSEGKAQGCFVAPYWDGYDIMGYADTGTSTETYEAGLTAMSSPQRISTGMLPSSDWMKVTTTSTVELEPVNGFSGVRAARVRDPRSDDVYFVEYRSGADEDSEALYATDGAWWRGDYIDESGAGWRSYEQTGVRVLKQLQNGETVALHTPHQSGKPKYISLALHKKDLAFRSRTGGVKVTVKSLAGGDATIRIRVRP